MFLLNGVCAILFHNVKVSPSSSFVSQATMPSPMIIFLPVIVSDDLSSTASHEPGMKSSLNLVSPPVTQESEYKLAESVSNRMISHSSFALFNALRFASAARR